MDKLYFYEETEAKVSGRIGTATFEATDILVTFNKKKEATQATAECFYP